MYVAQGLMLMHNSNKLLLKVTYNGIKLRQFVARFILFPMILIRLLSCSRSMQAMKARDCPAWGVLHSVSRCQCQKKGVGKRRKIAHWGFVTCILRSKWHSWSNRRRKVNFFHFIDSFESSLPVFMTFLHIPDLTPSPLPHDLNNNTVVVKPGSMQPPEAPSPNLSLTTAAQILCFPLRH